MIKSMFKGVEHKIINIPTEATYGDMEYDSRKVTENGVFVALEGTHVDGHKYIGKAIELGAKLIIASKEVEVGKGIGLVVVEDLRQKLGIIASNYYGWPQKSLEIIGVTGTNGKTTTTFILEKILGENKVARIGTVEYKIGERVIPAPNTTPESLDLIKICKEAVSKDIKHLIMEVSSHALEMGRVEMIDFDVAMFTNLTVEHLDFHKTIEGYYGAKRKLFLKLKDTSMGIYNIEDEHGEMLYKEFGGIGYGEEVGELRGKILESNSFSQRLEIEYKGEKREVLTKLLGRFNMMNILGSIGIGLKLGLELEEILEKVEALPGVPGRFEAIDCGQDFSVIVDYAHSEDALENILKTLNTLKKTKIITIFGCGGERAIDKRFGMGRVSRELSDYTILTADNPRSEAIPSIMKDIEVSFTKDGVKETELYEIVEERDLAIKRAIELAEKDDIILIAGKGHETYQILGDSIIDLDDRVEARKYIKEKLGK